MVDNFVKVVEVLAKLGSALAWPLVVLAILWWFRAALREFISNISEGSVKLFGFEALAKRKAIEAAATAEVTKVETSGKTPADTAVFLQSIGTSRRLADWLAHVSLNDLAGRAVLWVDDQPDNNTFEAEALRALGIEVEFATSTSEALRKLKGNEFDAIISDMARPGDDRAGYSLLATLRNVRPARRLSSTAAPIHRIKSALLCHKVLSARPRNRQNSSNSSSQQYGRKIVTLGAGIFAPSETQGRTQAGGPTRRVRPSP